MPTLHPYQQQFTGEIYQHWQQGSRNVIGVLPTGGGKTFTFSDIIARHQGLSCAIAHRQELVSQISLSLAEFGVKHRIIAPQKVIKSIINDHRVEFGRVFYDPNAKASVAGVDTLISRRESLSSWSQQITLWVQDEGHHVIAKPANKWGKAAEMFPNAIGLGVTATPLRADGKGLGAHADGLFTNMVLGPSMRELIEMGNLTDYDIVCPPSDFDRASLSVGSTGDFTSQKMKEASKKSHIVGDVVESYLKFAAGKQGITFTTDVETAHYMARQYKEAGVRAEAVSAKTPDHVRSEFIRRFRRGDLQQLVNVDLFGEGFDLPALEVVSMARPTESLAVYMQQFGRSLRVIKTNPNKRALIIDHVGNVVRHNLPDIPRQWTLDARAKRGSKGADPDVIPLTTCLECFKPYERFHRACPFCGHVHVPEGRRGPEQVDGDLELIDPEVLAEMRAAVEAVDRTSPAIPHNATAFVARGIMNRHEEKQQAQTKLRETIAIWAGEQRAAGRSDAESYKRFYLSFGIDVLSAKALNRADAEKLLTKVSTAINVSH